MEVVVGIDRQMLFADSREAPLEGRQEPSSAKPLAG